MRDLPKGWIFCRLEELTKSPKQDIVDGPFGSDLKVTEYINEGVPIIRLQNVDRNRFLKKNIKYISSQKAHELSRHSFVVGDLVVTKLGDPVGKACIIPTSFDPGVIVADVVRVRIDKRLGIKEFVSYAINSPEVISKINLEVKGSTRPRVNLGHIRALEIPLAPLNEQHRIVAKLENLLEKVESSQIRLEKIPAILKRLRQSVLAAACSGRLTADWRDKELQNNSSYQTMDGNEELPNSWRWKSIRDIANSKKGSIQSGPFGSNLLHSEFQSTGILVIGIDNVFEGKFNKGKQHRISHQKYELLKKYAARPLDVLVTVMATVGRCCVVPSDIETAIITKHVYRITVDQAVVNPYYLMQCIRGCPAVLTQVQDKIQGVTRPGINGTILKEINIPLPPITEQQEIVRRVEELFALADRIEARYQKAKAQVDKLTQSILAKAFRGELVPQDPNDEPASELLNRIKALKVEHHRRSKVSMKRKKG